jgi:plastocyanin
VNRVLSIIRTAEFIVVACCVMAAAVGFSGSSDSAALTIRVAHQAFTPSVLTVGQGSTVTWSFQDDARPSTTSRQLFWNSGRLPRGQLYPVDFPDAGDFNYDCLTHPKMKGSVHVPMRATGSPELGWTISWTSRTSTPTTRRYDVQELAPGGTWTAFRTNTADRRVIFKPEQNGTYEFRARTTNVPRKVHSAWSSTLSVRIS